MNAGDIAGVLDTYSGFLPGVVISLAVSLALGRRVGQILGARPILGFALVMAVGIALSATVSPNHDAPAHGVQGSGTCDLSRVGLPYGNQLAWPGEIVLNILLFLPLGVAIGLLPSSRAKLVVIALACVLPFTIEVIQLVAVPLGRECQRGDVIDNLTGLTLGIGVSAAVRWLGALHEAAGTDTRGRLGVAALAVAALVTAIVLTPLPTVAPAPRPAPSVAPPPTPAPSTSSVRVTSIAALLRALTDNTVSDIVVANGTYHVSPAASQASDSLLIDGRFAGRTRSVTVRAETAGGVTFDGGGAGYFGCLSFQEGAHDQAWEGFNCANGEATDTGIIVFGGHARQAAPHHITLRNITILASCTGRATSGSAPTSDHGILVSPAIDGPHDLLFEDITVDGTGGLASAFQFYNTDSEGADPNVWNVTVRRLRVIGTQQAIIVWDPTLQNVTFDTADIIDALSVAVRYESPGASGIVFANITSTGSGSGQGFHSSLGPYPSDVTFINNSFH